MVWRYSFASAMPQVISPYPHAVNSLPSEGVPAGRGGFSPLRLDAELVECGEIKRGCLSPLRGSRRGCSLPLLESTPLIQQLPGSTCITLPQIALRYESLHSKSSLHPENSPTRKTSTCLTLSPLRGSRRGFPSPLRGSRRGCINLASSTFLSLPLLVSVDRLLTWIEISCNYLSQYVQYSTINVCTSLEHWHLSMSLKSPLLRRWSACWYLSSSFNSPLLRRSVWVSNLKVSFESPLLRREAWCWNLLSSFNSPLLRRGVGPACRSLSAGRVRPMLCLRLQHQQDVFLSTTKTILPARSAGRTVAPRDSVVLLLRTAQRGKPRNSAFLLLQLSCMHNKRIVFMTRKKAHNPEDNYTHIIRTRVTEKTHRKLLAIVGNSNCHSIGEVARKILSRDKIITYTQDNTLDNLMEQLVLLRRELNAIGNNINQVTHQVHLAETMDQKHATAAGMLPHLKKVEGKLAEVLHLIQQLGQKWLQK